MWDVFYKALKTQQSLFDERLPTLPKAKRYIRIQHIVPTPWGVWGFVGHKGLRLTLTLTSFCSRQIIGFEYTAYEP